MATSAKGKKASQMKADLLSALLRLFIIIRIDAFIHIKHRTITIKITSLSFNSSRHNLIFLSVSDENWPISVFSSAIHWIFFQTVFITIMYNAFITDLKKHIIWTINGVSRPKIFLSIKAVFQVKTRWKFRLFFKMA